MTVYSENQINSQKISLTER